MNKIVSMLASLVIILTMVIPAVSSLPSEDGTGTGVVYTMTNSLAGNRIISYDRTASGILSLSGSFSTKGLGTGNSLGNQGGLVLTEDGGTLLVVNAGSNEISAFRVSKGLTLTDKVSSGGIQPISITVHKSLVYVLNAGGTGNIVGFRLNDKGKLSQIPGSIRPLSGKAVGPAEISFNPDGSVLAVTEKNTNKIDTYAITDDGTTYGPFIHASNGQTPFGFAFDKIGMLIVSEATTNALSSYIVDDIGDMETISGSIPDHHAAPCWVAITDDGKFAYTNNAHDGTTSSYKISQIGTLSLLNPVAGKPGVGNIDLALSKNSEFLYSLNPGTIAGFRANPDGSLTPIGTVSTIGTDGLAAR